MLSCCRWFSPYELFFLFLVQQQQTTISQYTDEITVFTGGIIYLRAQKNQHSLCVKTIH
jgi:hypothetical protein